MIQAKISNFKTTNSKNMKSFRYIFPATAALCMFALQLTAQEKLPTEKVDVYTNFQATIRDKDKQNISPVIKDESAPPQAMDYRLNTLDPAAVAYDAPAIRPLAMKTEKGPKAYRGFAKIGYGIPSSPYANAGYHYAQDDKFKIFANVLHHSANNKSVQNQKFSQTKIELGGGFNTSLNFAVDAGVKVEDQRYNFYSVDSLPAGLDPLRKFNGTAFGIKAYNSAENSLGVDYEAGFDFASLKSNFGVKENDFDIHLKGTKWFSDNFALSITTGNHITNLTDSIKSTLNNFYLRPALTLNGDIYKIRVGTNLIATNDEFKVLPDLEAMVNIAGNAFGAYAGWYGDVRKNTYRSLMEQNPFLVENISLSNSAFNRFYGGIRGKVGAIEYQGEAGYKSVNNMPLFVNDSLRPYGFGLVFDDLKIFDINGTMILNLARGLQFTGLVRYNIYTTDKQAEPWHLPNLESNLGLSLLTLNDRLKLKAEVYLADASYSVNYEGTKPLKNNALLDLSFEAAYRFSEYFGIFFQLNNLPNSKYKRYYNTPTYGLNILGGLTARF